MIYCSNCEILAFKYGRHLPSTHFGLESNSDGIKGEKWMKNQFVINIAYVVRVCICTYFYKRFITI